MINLVFTVVVSLEVNELRSVLGSISSTILLSRAWIISPYAVWDAMLLKGKIAQGWVYSDNAKRRGINDGTLADVVKNALK